MPEAVAGILDGGDAVGEKKLHHPTGARQPAQVNVHVGQSGNHRFAFQVEYSCT